MQIHMPELEPHAGDEAHVPAHAESRGSTWDLASAQTGELPTRGGGDNLRRTTKVLATIFLLKEINCHPQDMRLFFPANLFKYNEQDR